MDDETQEILSDPEMMIAINEGLAAIAAGDVISLEEFKKLLRTGEHES